MSVLALPSAVLSARRLRGDAEPGRRQVTSLPAAVTTPEHAAFTTGIAYGFWGLDPEAVDRLAILAREAVEHVAARVRGDRLLVICDLAGHLATVSVIVLDGELRDPAEPLRRPHLTTGDYSGVTRPELGPSVYGQVALA